MAVERIEQYRQLNGVDILKVILTPTKAFPQGGYFYAPREAESLVDSYTWYLNKDRSRVQIMTAISDWGTRKTLLFHKELFKFYRGYSWQEDIDHLNMIEFDNIDQNLNAVTRQQNSFNTLTKSYSYEKGYNCFRVLYIIDDKNYRPFSVVHREDEACIQADYVDKVILKEELGDDYYRFDFLKYRRGSEDILDLERTGVISEEEATYRHIMRYADNAWYYLRFGLEQYFKENNIQVPSYSLDENGFMIHPITGQKLCPITKGGRSQCS